MVSTNKEDIMPFIDSKITVPVSPAKKELLKSELGHAISIFRKPESFLMIGFEDNYDLYMGGNKLENGAFVSVSLFGEPSRSACEEMTAAICQLYTRELNIPASNIYITYQGYSNWGWNGQNF